MIFELEGEGVLDELLTATVDAALLRAITGEVLFLGDSSERSERSRVLGDGEDLTNLDRNPGAIPHNSDSGRLPPEFQLRLCS